jgi:OPT family oligopeptide transporter
MPMSIFSAFDNTGAPYNLTAVITNNTFDLAKYEQYSPMFLPITYAVSYGTIFATYTAVVVHTFLWYRHDIIRQLRRSLKDETDIHAHLMSKYPEAPRWWYIALGVFSFVVGVIGNEICHTGLPIWAFLVSLIFAMLFVVPLGIIQAITNQQIYLHVMSELIMGYMAPGRPLATMVFKMIGGNTVQQAVTFSGDLKFGHYMKIPPRLVFIGQVFASVVALFSAIVAQQWALDNIPDICLPDQKAQFVCPNLNTYMTSSVIWGGIGPKRFFSHGAM